MPKGSNMEKNMREIDRLLQQFFNSSIGFRELDIPNAINYPKYNISTDDEINYLVEVAVAGIPKEDIVVEEKHNNLRVTAKNRDVPENKKYLTKGITSKGFDLRIPIGKQVVIESAKYDNGILNIYLSKKQEDIKLITVQ